VHRLSVRIQRALVWAYCWHVVLNCAFSSFVVGMPLALLIPRRLDPQRRIPHRVGTFFWGWLVWRLIPFWRLEVEGSERLRQGPEPRLVCTNHQSLLDVLVLMSLGGDFKWVSGLRFFKIPMLSWYMRVTGYVPADLANPFSAGSVLDECGHWIERGISVGMFPEGTRSVDGRLGSFKPGGFRVAVERRVPVYPVAIDGTREILPKGGSSYLGESPFKTVRVRVLPPISVDDLQERSPAALSRACRERVERALAELRGEAPPGAAAAGAALIPEAAAASGGA
jgi:1-acyl-sn-glycerol-3-phosphate acyltransferase